ncbi:MAG: hypothetical protein QM768_08545 [Agriterribacter sp.]
MISSRKRLEHKAVFGIFNYGAGSGESYIKANEEGLRLFAIKLLQSAEKANEISAGKETNIIPFDYNGDWIDEKSATFIQYVKPVSGKQFTDPPPQKPRASTSNRLILYTWIIGIIALLITAGVGFLTILRWIF